MWIKSLKEGWGNCMRNLGEGYCPGEWCSIRFLGDRVSKWQGLLGVRVSGCQGFGVHGFGSQSKLQADGPQATRRQGFGS